MEDRRASWIAAAFGSVAIGGFWIARPEKQPSVLRVSAQWRPDDSYGPDKDAAVAFRVETKGALRDLALDGRFIEYRVVDARGHGYPLVTMADPLEKGAFKLLKGYPRELESPRLLALVNGKPMASAPVAPLPKVDREPLAPTPSPPLFLLSRGGDDLIVRTTKPMPKDERWRVRAIRTAYTATETRTEMGPLRERSDFGRLLVPYAREAGLVAVEVTRYRLVPKSEVVQVPDLRLIRRYGGTAVLAERSIEFQTSLGAKVRVPRQDNGPHRPVQHGDPRSVFVTVAVSPPEAEEGSLETDLSAGRMRGPRIDILAPRPESLGLREIRFGGAASRSTRLPQKDVPETSFTLTARLTFFRPVPIDRFRAVVPVRIAPPSPFGDYRYGGPRMDGYSRQ